MKIAVTGAGGLIGWHAAGRIHAAICAARFRGAPPPYDLIQIDHATFADAARLSAALEGVDAVLHFAGVNRGEEAVVERANPDIARALVRGLETAGVTPHIVYANSTHAASDTPYGRSKRIAGEILAAFAPSYTDLVLPHIFGECARPNYNNVTATLIDTLWRGETPSINADGRVQLLHAGAAAQMAIDAVLDGRTGRLAPKGRDMTVADLDAKLRHFHALYTANIFPDLSDPFDLALFNTYRTGGYPTHYPRPLKVNADPRGILFESAKGGNAAQSFLSTTLPGQKRGDHFHLDLVERFLVVKGEALIRIRRVLTDDVQEFAVSGDRPVAIDMPPLHTHNIENRGEGEVITFFWSHHLFDPANPDTYADPV
ncbi:capsule biosynthesis protein CapF [Sphingopyxis lindanitolerans]|uniref:Capsule biosynthesis protein CapF n=1 Tax=Sphingopyxis lindanitolerans TaxID=2054227 RepID=A0A2S8B4W0_9SPHN|nr:NAD-dependent epimerase/dehydratase family protein [Sphingopyxis lindanitolerans]PQM27435.1 capsule biosynthesis protein CapF [Sphingopyxis lindanitolerans]